MPLGRIGDYKEIPASIQDAGKCKSNFVIIIIIESLNMNSKIVAARYSPRLRRVVNTASILLLCIFFASCTSKAVKRKDTIGQSVRDGDFIGAVNDIKKNARLYGETNAFLFNMDIGVLYHYAGMHDSSNVYLQRAADIYDELFTRSVTNEAAAILTNDNVRPYRAKPFELVLLHQFAALNFMAAGRANDALVEVRRAQIHFNEWERTRGNTDKYHSDGMFHLIASLAYEAAGEVDNSLISLYKAIAAYNMGPVRLPPDLRDFAARRLKAGGREGDLLRLDLTADSDAPEWGARMGASEIVIIGYAGKGPNLREQNWSGHYVKDGLLTIQTPGIDGRPRIVTIDAPMLPRSEYEKASRGEATKSGTTFYIKLSLPQIQTFNSQTAYFTAYLTDDEDSDDAGSVLVNDIDKQLQKALDDAWGATLARTAIRVVLRTITAEKAKGRMQTSNPLLNLATNLSTDVASSQLERADVRTCFILPQTMHMIRIPVDPGTHSVTLNVHNTTGRVIGKKEFNNIEVKRGEKKVLIHQSLR